MNKILKWVLRIVGVLLLLILALFLWINATWHSVHPNEAPELTVEKDSASIAEGRRIATMLCNQCHRSEDGKLGGSLMEDGEFGKVYSANITQHPELGITDYTDGELAYLIRTGITKEGLYTPPWMLKLPNLSDEDLHDIIAFLRSDDPMVQPSDFNPPPADYSFLTKALLKFGVFGPLPYPDQPINPPDTTDDVAFGKYMVSAKWDCYSCHSADFTKQDLLVPENSLGYLGGGNPIPDLQGNIVLSANLTFDDETGIGTWSEEDFATALKTGIRPDKTAFSLPMTPYPALTDKEVKAIYAYLKTVPVIKNPKLLKE